MTTATRSLPLESVLHAMLSPAAAGEAARLHPGERRAAFDAVLRAFRCARLGDEKLADTCARIGVGALLAHARESASARR